MSGSTTRDGRDSRGNGGGARARILARVARATAMREKHAHPGRLKTPAAANPAATFVKRFTSQGGEVATPDPDRSPRDWLTSFLERAGRPCHNRRDRRGCTRPVATTVAGCRPRARRSRDLGGVGGGGRDGQPHPTVDRGAGGAAAAPGSRRVGARRPRLRQAGGRAARASAGIAGRGGAALRTEQVRRYRADRRDRGARAGAVHCGADSFPIHVAPTSATPRHGMSVPASRSWRSFPPYTTTTSGKTPYRKCLRTRPAPWKRLDDGVAADLASSKVNPSGRSITRSTSAPLRIPVEGQPAGLAPVGPVLHDLGHHPRLEDGAAQRMRAELPGFTDSQQPANDPGVDAKYSFGILTSRLRRLA